MSIESTCTPSCLVTGSHISPGPGRRSALSLMIGLARMWSGWPTFLHNGYKLFVTAGRVIP
jgi:hypothetical protein